MSNKRATTVGILTAGIAASILATTVGPAAAQGHPVGGKGNLYFLSGAINESGQASKILVFGDNSDEVLYGDWNGDGLDEPMARRGNVFFPANQDGATQNVFVYGDAGDKVLVGDWNGDGIDSLAVQRDNHFFVKNDNTTSGKADTDFFYGDKGDTVLVGNWDGQSQMKDANGNYIVNDKATVQSGVKNTTYFVTDTIMVQRGNQFFVKNDTKTGVAEYSFFFGDTTDQGNILVGDWATPVVQKTSTVAFTKPGDANGKDQIAVRRGFMDYQSGELQAAHDDKKNPATISTFAYGNPDDTVFVASRPGVAKSQQFFLNTDGTTKVALDSAPAGLVFDDKGTPLVNTYTAATTTANTLNSGVRPAANLTAAPITAYKRDGSPITVAVNEWFTTAATGTNPGAAPSAAPSAAADYLFDAKGLPLLSVTQANYTAADVMPKTEAQLKDAQAVASTFAGATDSTRPSLDASGTVVTRTGATTLGFVVFDRYGVPILETGATYAVEGDGLGVRR